MKIKSILFTYTVLVVFNKESLTDAVPRPCEASCDFINSFMEELKIKDRQITELQNKLLDIADLKFTMDVVKELMSQNTKDRFTFRDMKILCTNTSARIEDFINKQDEKSEKLQQLNETNYSLVEENNFLTRLLNESQESFLQCKKEIVENSAVKPSSCVSYDFEKSPGIHEILVPGLGPLQVRCDDGWTVVEKRFDGSVDFNRNWTEYRNGFGDLNGEFFIGLENLYHMTKSGKHQIKVDLTYSTGTHDGGTHSDFSMGSEDEGYVIKSLGYFAGADNGLEKNLNQKFSTYDRDNDEWVDGNCAKRNNGGWWYGGETYNDLLVSGCGSVNPNGKWQNQVIDNDTMYWDHYLAFKLKLSLKEFTLLVRPKKLQNVDFE